MCRTVEPFDRPEGVESHRPRASPAQRLGGLKATLAAVVQRAGKDERLATAAIVWAVLGAVLAASGARVLAWSGFLGLGVAGAILTIMTKPRRDRER